MRKYFVNGRHCCCNTKDQNQGKLMQVLAAKKKKIEILSQFE